MHAAPRSSFRKFVSLFFISALLSIFFRSLYGVLQQRSQLLCDRRLPGLLGVEVRYANPHVTYW
jgi:hypothetical protein